MRPGGLQIFIEAEPPNLVPGWSTLASMPVSRKFALAGSATLMLTPAVAILWLLGRLFGLFTPDLASAVIGAMAGLVAKQAPSWLNRFYPGFIRLRVLGINPVRSFTTC